MSKTVVIVLTCLSVLSCVLFGVGIFVVKKISPKYDITMTESKRQRIENCNMPPGWKIITDGRNFSWETDSGYRSLQTFDSPLDVCLQANTCRGFFKRNWRYLK